ncbi:transposase [Moorella sp. E308F]|uniref:Rpn family recombination-promoting nuclease/putative transposase n=1 Tax=unclassified Neomoorella TaxID=2676739 RepID=UPI0010FFBA74|nr:MULTISPECIES: Rpn family recombination-promoting nuclease/putative transposase [unclassified Moorella (in: firmicutes)]GEA15390.1 transposase [Moorella sp. E308F]GEA19749.1 transposase [Moorella sp. E306M]
MPENAGQPRPPHHPHDKGYRQLLADKRVFLELLKTFVREEWVEAIDSDDLILVNKSYVLQDFSEKEADIVYRLKTKDKNVIFYVLLELQSTVDYLIPFRLLLYMVEIWREIYNNTPQHERESKHFRLPPIIPAVLYNGAGSWTAALSFKEMLDSYRDFSGHLLDFRYLLFDVNRYSEEELIRAANLIASVFLLDQRMRPEELVGRLQKLAGVLRRLTPDEFRHFTTWLKNVVKPRIPGDFSAKIDGILDASNPWEVEQMIYNLELTLEEMQRQALLKGEMKGKMEVAKNLLRLGIELDKIAQATELSPEEIATLKKQLE